MFSGLGDNGAQQIATNIAAVPCSCRIVKVNQPTRVIDDGTPQGQTVTVPAVASQITYNVEVYGTPEGNFYIERIVPDGDRPEPPFYCRPAKVGSWWPCIRIGMAYVFMIAEREATGPCKPVVIPPATTTGAQTLPAIQTDPRFNTPYTPATTAGGMV